MSERYLLDTNVLSEPLAARPDPAVLEKLEHFQHQLVTAAPVWHELTFGCRRLQPSDRRRRIERYLDEVIAATLTILPYDHQAASWHAAERARLTSLGQTPAFVDGQIAAIAAVNGATLVTRNVTDFSCFHQLSVVDWFLDTA